MTEQAKNIVLIVADELRADALGCYGSEICRTPNLDLVGLEEPDAMQGVSMREALCDDGALPRDAVMTENDDDFVPMRARTLTTKKWKVTMYAGSTEGELYDREADPDELHNLWEDSRYEDIKMELLAALADHMVCAVDGLNGPVQSPRKPVARFVPREQLRSD